MAPWPEQSSHLPPSILNEKRLGLYPRILDSGSCPNNARISSKILTYVAGIEREVLPIGDWSTSKTPSKKSAPETSLQVTELSAAFLFLTRLSRTAGRSTDLSRVLLPEPDTPVITE